MKILAVETPIPETGPDAFRPHIRSEALRVHELWQAGIIREAYFRQERAEAVLVLECRDAPEAERVLQSLPLVHEHLITFELIPLRPYSGFYRLFGQ